MITIVTFDGTRTEQAGQRITKEDAQPVDDCTLILSFIHEGGQMVQLTMAATDFHPAREPDRRPSIHLDPSTLEWGRLTSFQRHYREFSTQMSLRVLAYNLKGRYKSWECCRACNPWRRSGILFRRTRNSPTATATHLISRIVRQSTRQ
jgi:hypothetical protein